MSAPVRVVPGKLKLKAAAGAPPAPAAGLAGTKRPRVPAPSATEAPAGGAGGGAASAAPAADAPPAAAPTRTQGVGKLITSGTTVHGVATKFKEELKVGDAIEVAHPVSLKAEVRVVKMVLSDVSCGINAPFSADLVAALDFFVLRLPKRAVDPAVLKASADALRRDEELKTSVFASDGGTKLTYRVTHGHGYKTVTEAVGTGKTREEILDLRAKKKSDKYC